MQFTVLVSAIMAAGMASCAAAVALPNGGSSSSAPSCGNSATQACCDVNGGFTLLSGCLLNAVALTGCNSGQSLACCPNEGEQTGLINIGTVCVPISV